MAIAIDKTSLGTNAVEASATTIVLTTTQAVASSGFIVLGVGWYTSGVSISSVAGGSLSWTVDHQTEPSPSLHNQHAALVSAQAPSGLASSTAITVTFSAGAVVRHIGGMSFTGVATSSPVDTTAGPVKVEVADNDWSSGSVSLLAGSVLVACCFLDSGNVTSTATSPSVESFDSLLGSAPNAMTAAYRIGTSAGSYSVDGVWSGNVQSTTNAVAYKAAAGEPPWPPGDNPAAPPLRLSRSNLRLG